MTVTAVAGARKRWFLCVLAVAVMSVGCATGRYTPLVEAEHNEIEQLQENVYRVEYRVSPFTSQEQLDAYVKRRGAELALREGYDWFRLSQRADVLMLTRRTAMTVTLYKGGKPPGAYEFYDAKAVLRDPVGPTAE